MAEDTCFSNAPESKGLSHQPSRDRFWHAPKMPGNFMSPLVGAQDRSKTPQDRSRPSQDPPKIDARRTKFALRGRLQDRSKITQDRPKRPQDRFKTTQDGPKRLQDHPKIAPRCSWIKILGDMLFLQKYYAFYRKTTHFAFPDRPRQPKIAPKASQDRSRPPQDGQDPSKLVPRLPHYPQRHPKSPPRGLKMPSRSPLETSRCP